MTIEAASVDIREYVPENTEELKVLFAKAFLLSNRDTKMAFARAMLSLMN